MKKRLLIIGAGVLLALVPAAAGAVGNTSLSHRVPVSDPTTFLVPDDHGSSPEPGDDRGTATAEPGDDRAAPTAQPTTGVTADDHGGLTPRDARTEPGDDRAANGTAPAPAASPAATPDDHGGLIPRDQRTEPGDDHGSGHGGSSGGGDH